eukprot:403371680
MEITDFEKDQKQVVFKDTEIDILYMAKCIDSEIPFYQEQMHKFKKYCDQESFNRKVKFIEMSLGIQMCKVLSDIVLKSDRIVEINLSRNKVGDEGAKIFAELLIKTNRLVKLDLSSNEISRNGAKIISEALVLNNSLYHLSFFSYEGLHSNFIGEEGSKSLAKMLQQNKILSMLDVGGNKLGNNGLSYLSMTIQESSQSSLIYLNISNNDITQEGCQYFLKSLIKSHLIELDMSKSLIGLKGAQQFGEVLKLNHFLQKLSLSQCEIGPRGLQDIMNGLKRNKSLTHLNLSRNDFQFSLPNSLSSMFMINSTLQVLDLSFCRLGSQMMLGITDGLFLNKQIKKLLLRDNQIEDHPIEILSHILLNPQCTITHLDLSQNFITDFGGVALAQCLSFNTSLQYLNLKLNYLQDETAQQMLQSIRGQNKHIKKMNLKNNFISLRFIGMIEELLKQNQRKESQYKIPEYKQTIKQLRGHKLKIQPTIREIEETKLITEVEQQRYDQQKVISQKFDMDEEAQTRKLMEIKEMLMNQIQAMSKEIERKQSEYEEKQRKLIDDENMASVQLRDITKNCFKRAVDIEEHRKIFEKRKVDTGKQRDILMKELNDWTTKLDNAKFGCESNQKRIEIEKSTQEQDQQAQIDLLKVLDKKRPSAAGFNSKTPTSPLKQNINENAFESKKTLKKKKTIRKKLQ